MKFRFVHLAAALAFLAPGHAHAAPAGASAEAAEAKALEGLDAFVAETLAAWDAPGAAISIVKDGKVILSKGYGVRDPRTGAPMTADTLFPIQSETKAFTAFTVGVLVDEGKLSWDAPVFTYIPGFRLEDATATQEASLRDFLSHRSGMASYGWLWLSNKELTRKAAVARMAHLPLQSPIRTSWSYANMGYVASAEAVEVAAGMPWERFTEERILRPLGMGRTTLSPQEANADPNHVAGTMWLRGRKITTPMQGTTPATFSTGGIYSTANDMTNWMQLHLAEGAHEGRQLIRRETLAEMHTPQMLTRRPVPLPEFTSSASGLGWFVESYRGERLVEHGGNHWGVGSSLGLLPDRELGVSVFVNQDGDLAAFMMFSILDRFIGPGARDWTRAMLPEQKAWIAEGVAKEKARAAAPRGRPAPRPLADYAGVYEHPGFGPVAVRFADGALVARYGGDESDLQQQEGDVFLPARVEFGNVWTMVDDLKVQFLPGYDGQVGALRLSGVVDGVVFKRQAAGGAK